MYFVVKPLLSFLNLDFHGCIQSHWLLGIHSPGITSHRSNNLLEFG